jgi:2-dehydro-3-deoxy-D-arabinonate dehydratase
MTPPDPVRLCAVHDAGHDAPRLCRLAPDGELRPVGTHRDASALVAAHPGAPTLEDAVQAAGLGTPLRVKWPEAMPAVPARPAEVWAAGVTYQRSRDARVEESASSGDHYERLYDAERPELFLKATGPRIVGPEERIGLRSDSAWQVPEPELALLLGTAGQILGYTLGNDLSSRDIEGENPLYLPQAKIFAASCALGPIVVSAAAIPDAYNLRIELTIRRAGAVLWQGETSTAQFNTRLERLIEHLRRDNWVGPGTVLLTGTGIVPDDEITLEPGDVVEIACAEIGTLRNTCAAAAELSPPQGWSAAPAAA